MPDIMKYPKGFTLIEVIASLVIIGIMTAIAGMGLVQAARGFLFARDNAQKAQTGQLVMSRLSKAVTNWTLNDNLTTGWLSDSGTDKGKFITLERKHNTAIIVETYTWDSSAQTLTIGEGENNTDPKILAENVENFSFTFLKTDGTEWVGTAGDAIAELATVGFNLTLIGDNSSSTLFTKRVVPRNTYDPSQQYLNPGSGGITPPTCFVATASFGRDDDPCVELLKEFRDKVLVNLPGGKSFIKFYYTYGPGLAGIIEKSREGKGVTRIILSPVIGLVFLWLYFPEGFGFIALAAWMAARLFRRKPVTGSMPPSVPVLNEQGGAIIMIIAGLLLFGVIGAGIVSMNNSAMYTQIGNNNSAQAYLLAEGGGRYSAYTYKENMNDGTLTTLHNQGQVTVDGARNLFFYVEIAPYWFNLDEDDSESVTSDCVFPEMFDVSVSGNGSPMGYLRVGSVATLYPYTGYTKSNSSDTVTFNGTGGITGSNGDEVFLAARAGSNQSLSQGGTLTLESGTTGAFPLFNGIVEVTSNSSGTSETYVVRYGKKKGNKLMDLDAVEGEKTLPFSVNTNDPIVLTKFADIKSTGIVGTGDDAITRTITYSQPLFQISLYKRKEWSTNFDNESDINKFKEIIGEHGYDSGEKALKITRTSEEKYYTGWAIDIIPYKFEESVIGLKHTATSLGIYDAWSESDNTLSYDIQTKVRFSKEDDLELNYLGTYMPGLSFRLNSNGSNYYGLSILRGIPGYKYHFGIPGWREVKDDIPDTLFNDHDADSQRPAHNDVKPLAGMPYLVLWQKSDQSVWTHLFGSGDSIEEYEWLSYLALCDIEVVHDVWYYPGGEFPIPGSCGGFLCGICCSTNTSSWPCGGCWDWETVPERGWYVGNDNLPSDQSYAQGPFTIIKLTEKAAYSGVLNYETEIIDGVERTFLGRPGHAVIKDSSTGAPIENVAFILPENPSSDFPEDDPGSFNYRIYPKNWITLMARVLEFKKDLDGDGTDEQCNAIQAWAAGPDTHERDTIKWPEDGNYLSKIIWNDYTSQQFSKNILGYPLTDKALLAKIQTDENPETVYSAFLTTRDYPNSSSDWGDIPEVGLHSLGIDVRTSAESVFFDDFGVALYEKSAGLYPPVQSE